MRQEQETVRLVRSMFGAQVATDPDQFIVKCPVCGYDYTSFDDVRSHAGGDYEAKEVHGMGVRGPVLEVEFSCEAGHSWVLVFGWHKGQTYGKLVTLKS